MFDRIDKAFSYTLALSAYAMIYYVLFGSFLFIIGLEWYLVNEHNNVLLDDYIIPLFFLTALLSTFPVTRQITHLFPPSSEGYIPKWLLFACLSLLFIEITHLCLGKYDDSGSYLIGDIVSGNSVDFEALIEYTAWEIWNPWLNGFVMITDDPGYPEELWFMVQQSFLVPLQILILPMLLMRYKWLLAGIRKPNWIFLRSFHGKSDPQLLHILAKSIPRGTNLLYLVPNMRKRDILSSFSLRSISARFGSRTIPVSSNSVPWEKVVEKFLKHHAVPIVDTSHIGSKGLKHEVKKVGDDTLEQPVLWLVDRKLMLPAFKLIELTGIHEYKLEYILCYQDTIIGRFLGIVIQFIWIGIVLIILFFTAKGVISDTELNILLSIALSFIAIFIVYNLFTPSTNYIFHKKLRRLLHVIRKRYTGNECWER